MKNSKIVRHSVGANNYSPLHFWIPAFAGMTIILFIFFNTCCFAAPLTKQQFINKMVTKNHFDRIYISNLIYSVKVMPKPIRHIKHPYEAKPWYIYRQTFINKVRINAGVAYWLRNKYALQKAEKIYGVPPGVIVAIVGVESRYGKDPGFYSVLNVLVNLAFTYSKQAEFFQYELEQYFLMVRELGLDATKIQGSFGGAMGYPQFVPSAFRRFAVDFNNDGKKDLFHDTPDVVGSVANFLNHYGWHKNEPIMVRAIVSGNKYKKILNNKFSPQFTVAELKKYHIKPVMSLADDTQVNLIRLKLKDGYEFWLTLHNFYVMIHYNVSNTYAMAVYQLADEITKAYSTRLKQAFINKMAVKYKFNKNYTKKIVNNIRFLPEVIEHMQQPSEALPWHLYKDKLVTEERIQDGVKFWRQHRRSLVNVQKKYGVPASIIVSIIGIESNYGQEKGEFLVLNALGTLAFDYPLRGDFFQDELCQYLLLTKELNLNPLALYGSYAGAMGYPQFIPSSYRHYAMHKDLFHNVDDAIASVAYYLQKNGWQKDRLIAMPAKVTGSKYYKILNDDLDSEYTISTLRKYGINPYTYLADNQQANLIRLKAVHGYEYWLGLHDFYVITTYNKNSKYAMAVYQLAEKLQNLYYAENSATTSSSRRG